MPAVTSTTPVLVEPTPDTIQTLIINNGGQPVYYRAGFGGDNVSATVNDGTLNSGAQMIVNGPVYLLAVSANASVDVSNVEMTGQSSNIIAQKTLMMLAIQAEMLAEGLGVKNATLDYPGDFKV